MSGNIPNNIYISKIISNPIQYIIKKWEVVLLKLVEFGKEDWLLLANLLENTYNTYKTHNTLINANDISDFTRFGIPIIRRTIRNLKNLGVDISIATGPTKFKRVGMSYQSYNDIIKNLPSINAIDAEITAIDTLVDSIIDHFKRDNIASIKLKAFPVPYTQDRLLHGDGCIVIEYEE